MKSKQVLGILFTIVLITTIQPSQALTLDQDRVTFAMKDRSFSSSGKVLKGVDLESNNSRFELIISSLVNTRDVIRLFGAPTIEQTPTEISVNGTLNGYNTHAVAYRNAFMQKDSYIPDIPVNERIIKADRIFRDHKYDLDVDRTFELNMTYDEIANDGNFTKRVNEKHNVDIFILRYFEARIVQINDSAGNILGNVYGFSIYIQIHVFDSDSHDYVAFHKMHTFGYGNMLPDRVNEYLAKLKNEHDSRNNRRVVNDTRPGPLAKINWFDLGFNDTLALNMLYGFYELERNSRTVVLPRDESNSVLGLSSLGLDQETSLELLIDDIAAEQQMPGFEDDDLEGLDVELAEVTLKEDGVSIDDAFEPATSSSKSKSDDTSSEDDTDASVPLNFVWIILPITLIPLFRRKISK